ncbi:hypothetical protein HanPI659440_Chr15g0591051 [Helianthus annuus]|nr:hypothetical protein HanPI659440_Chr15g0591051 [Helianthus annuus]
MNLSREPLGMNSYIKAFLRPSKQNPIRLTILTWDVLPTLATSLMKSSPSPLSSLKTFTATRFWFPSTPLYTVPKPPWPNSNLKEFVIFSTCA